MAYYGLNKQMAASERIGRELPIFLFVAAIWAGVWLIRTTMQAIGLDTKTQTIVWLVLIAAVMLWIRA